MNRLKIYIFILSLFFGMISCKKDLLDVVDNSILNRQSYVKDLNTMEHFMNGIHILLSNDYGHGIGDAYPELVSDNLKPLSSGTQSLALHYSWSQKATDVSETKASENSLAMNGDWSTSYLIIRACSFVIEEISKYRNENPTKADHMKGQAYAIRALVHFKLVNIFAQTYSFDPNASHPGVPYITTSDISVPFHRQTTAEVYAGMIDDLKSALQLLSGNTSDPKFMNKPAANALLARIYLFKGDYNNAKNLSIEIANRFPLLTIASGYPNSLFKDGAQFPTETFFQLVPINSRSYVSRYLGRYLRGSSIRYNATNDIAVILKENSNDIRNQWVNNSLGQWNVTKFPVNVATNVIPAITIPETSYYPAIIRSSEIFLIAAESSAKLNDESSARYYIDAIRKRADPTISSITATGVVLLDSIYKERRKELAFEGLRMYDLQRWHMDVIRQDFNPLYPNARNLTFPSNKAIAPIPIQDIRLAGLPPNPGY